MKPEISVIILSFNTKAVTLACLESIYQHTSIDFEVIVVDNASTDGSVDALSKFEKKHNNFTLIASDKNLGFGAGNNLGVSKAKGDYVLILNSDTLFKSDILPVCLKQIKSNHKIGTLGIKLLNRDLTEQASGGAFPTLCRLIYWQFFIDDLPLVGHFLPSIHPHSYRLDRDWITGAFMLFPKSVYQKVGGFDEKIFMYTEEMELCYRLKKAGYQVFFDPNSSLVHLGKASGGSHLALTLEVKYMLYFWQKHFPRWQYPLVKLIFWKGALLRYFIFGIIKGDSHARQTYAKILQFSF